MMVGKPDLRRAHERVLYQNCLEAEIRYFEPQMVDKEVLGPGLPKNRSLDLHWHGACSASLETTMPVQCVGTGREEQWSLLMSDPNGSPSQVWKG